MLKNLVSKILKGDIPSPSIPQWIAGFTVIVIIRAFLEINANPQNAVIGIENSSRVHFVIFFALITLLFALTVSIFAKQRGNTVINLALYGLPIIFIAPIADIMISGGKGAHMSFIFDTGSKLFNDFLLFGGVGNGASTGMQIEVLLILSAIGWYVWAKTKKIMLAIGAVLSSYTLLFIVAALPSVLYMISALGQDGALATYSYDFIEKSVVASNIPTNILNEALSYPSPARLITLGTTALFSQTLFILLFVVGLAWFWYAHSRIAKVIFKNIRTSRILLGLGLIALGAFTAHSVFSVVFTWVDWVSLAVLEISWFGACMYAIHVNDIADIEIDKISSPERPLPKGDISIKEMHDIGLVWLILSLVGAYLVGYHAFFMSTIFTSAYYLYSAQPLRLKRIPVLSSFLISIAVLVTFLAGFFFASPDKSITEFPLLYALGIIIVFTLGVNIRDIKDVEGDRAAGIQTLPVIFGKHGRHIVGALLALSFILAPLFLPFFTSYAVAIPTAIVGYWLCIKNPYEEHYIFILFFVFCVASILFR
ncbi:MAG: UbiA family prenyltransferase [Candidatus Pacebacteria bacterium]|jgi:4-hydroxybenzoate polyprenyltransferase|nr:UbiA family prenyltransferase [Candidatus Paceibacterota bacterium]